MILVDKSSYAKFTDLVMKEFYSETQAQDDKSEWLDLHTLENYLNRAYKFLDSLKLSTL